eukprot:GHRQ01029136.1.p2 GENE.GHRQ01029136.1~~GHRQ01029136.1.p2  ORF type:complete len:100 (-),score=16.83 GHRQ01029136.1:246-545(-)
MCALPLLQLLQTWTTMHSHFHACPAQLCDSKALDCAESGAPDPCVLTMATATTRELPMPALKTNSSGCACQNTAEGGPSFDCMQVGGSTNCGLACWNAA